MDRPVLAVIILVAGVSLSVIVATISGNYMVFWRRSPGVWIESVDILMHPQTGAGFITVHVRNVGGQNLVSCAVTLLTTPPRNIDDIAVSDIAVGRAGTFYEGGVPGLQSNRIYVFEVSCLAEDGSPVVDKRSAMPHI